MAKQRARINEFITWPDLFNKHGGVEALAQQAAEDAAREVREDWLARLETLLPLYREDADNCADEERWNAAMAVIYIEYQIKRLRRALGIKTPDDERRRQTRDRVRAFRERKKADAGSETLPTA